MQRQPVRAPVLLLATMAALAWSTRALAQAQAEVPDIPLQIALETVSAALRDARGVVLLSLNRPVTAHDGELVLLAGTIDVSALTTISGTRVSITPGAFRLPSGEWQLTVLRRLRGRFFDVATLPMRVGHAGGFLHASTEPTLDVSSSGALASGQSGAPGDVGVSEGQNLSISGNLRSTHERPGFGVQSQWAVVGTDSRALALRFAQRGGAAPLVDLSSYLLSLQLRGTRVDVGHVALGTNRHLVSGFSSRGVSLTAGPAWAQLSLGSVAGAPIVGWDNALGVAEATHRLNTAALALEVVRGRPGALQLRLTALDGSLQPRAGFTQGAVTDAEASHGGGVEVTATSPGQRARLAAGYTRSTFSNPARDSQLTGGLLVERSVRDRRAARYVESSLGLVQGARLFRRFPTQLTATVRHERVDPLFRSVGVSTQADREQDGVDINGAIGALTVQGGLARARDNLASVGSVLTSRTEGRTAHAAFSLAALLGIHRYMNLWPQVTVGWTRSHQFAQGAPSSNDFRPRDLADQVADAVDMVAAWQLGRWRASVRQGRTEVDNRQVSRERSDFSGSTNNLSLATSLGTVIDASLDAGIEEQRNREFAQVNLVRRLGGTLNWRVTSLTSLGTNVSAAISRTPPQAQDVTNVELRVELAQRIRLPGRGAPGRSGQAFLRFARTTVTAAPFEFDSTSAPLRLTTQMQWTLNSGLSLRLW